MRSFQSIVIEEGNIIKQGSMARIGLGQPFVSPYCVKNREGYMIMQKLALNICHWRIELFHRMPCKSRRLGNRWAPLRRLGRCNHELQNSLHSSKRSTLRQKERTWIELCCLLPISHSHSRRLLCLFAFFDTMVFRIICSKESYGLTQSNRVHRSKWDCFIL